MWGPISLLIVGLVAVGFLVGIQQSTWLDDLSGGAVLAVFFCFGMFGMLAVLLSTQLILSSILPTPGYQALSEREGRLGGILIAMPLLIGIINACVGDVERSPLFIPIFMLNVVGVSVAFWFLGFCIGHVVTQGGPVLIKGFWIVAFMLGNLVVMPLYWYLFVWRPHLTHPSRCEK
jgi:hypothetical protein